MTIDYSIDVAPLTTFGIHAKAAAVAYYDRLEDLYGILGNRDLPRPFKHIGQGSNLLFANDFPGTLIVSRCENYTVTPRTDSESGDDFLVEAENGLPLDRLCSLLAADGYWGLENLSGIPGTVGAAPVQNVGAYGVEAKDVIVSAEVYDRVSGEVYVMKNAEMEFGYRASIFKKPKLRDRLFVTKVTFAVTRRPQPRLGYANLEQRAREIAGGGEITPATVRVAVCAIRDEKLPDVDRYGSAGSFFKNPVVESAICADLLLKHPDMPHFSAGEGMEKLSAAWLLDRAGAKKLRVGDAAVWPTQPLVIYNAGHATAKNVLMLEDEIITLVFNTFGIRLRPEVEHLTLNI